MFSNGSSRIFDLQKVGHELQRHRIHLWIAFSSLQDDEERWIYLKAFSCDPLTRHTDGHTHEWTHTHTWTS